MGAESRTPFSRAPFSPPPPPPPKKKNKKKQTRKSARKLQMGGLEEYMIGGLPRAYPQPCLGLLILLKYVEFKGECPSAPRTADFFLRLSPFGKERTLLAKT